MLSRGYEPEEVICSSARRTQETWELVAMAPLEVRPEVRLEAGLYQASPEKMLKILRSASQPTVMVLGHNPGIAEFAAMMPAHPPIDPDFRRYPTAATLVIDFQIESWPQAEPGRGSVQDFIRIDGRI